MSDPPTDSQQCNHSVDVVPLTGDHLPDAARLFVAGYRALRRKVPSLPSRHEDADAIAARLRKLAAEQPGVAAVRGGKLAGFLLAEVLPGFRGVRSAYAREWAHGAEEVDRRAIYRAMYARLSGQWVADGRLGHIVTLLADQRRAIDAFSSLEFGMLAADAIRDLTPVRAGPVDVEIRRAGPEDIDAVMGLLDALWRHMTAAPIFMVARNLPDRPTLAGRLADPEKPSWLGWSDGQPVAWMHVRRGEGEAEIVRDGPHTAAVRGAITLESHRARGIGAALLARAVEWTRGLGCRRLSVDFEPQNIPGERFWLKHFDLVCTSMFRRVSDGAKHSREQ